MPPSSLAAALAASKTAPTKNDTQPGSSLQRRNARNTGSREKGGGKPTTVDKDEPTSPDQQARRQQKHNSRRNRKGKAKSPKREENEGDQSIEQNLVFLCDLSEESSDDGSSVEKPNQKKQTPRRQKRGVRYDGKGKGQRAGRDGGRTNPIEGHDRYEWRNREGQNNQRRESRNRKGCDIGAASTPTRAAPPRTPWSNKAKATAERNSDRSHGRSRASESAGRGRADNMPSPRGQGDANTSLSLPLRNEELANVQVPFKLEAATIKGRWADEDSSDDD